LLHEGPGSPGKAKIAVIAGMAGVGKTTLAVHWANQVAAAFPDGQLYLNLNGFGPAGVPMSQANAISRMLEALQVPTMKIPSSLEGRIGLYRTLLSERRILIVLDNARDADQVRPLLPGGGGCLVVVTSRSRLTGLVAIEGARTIFLNVLTEPEARRMVAQRLGPGRTAADRAATGQLIRACARLPLALAIATALVANRPDQSLALVAANLARVDRRLDDLDTGEAATSLRAVFTWSCRALTPQAARLFRLLAEHPGPDISAAAAASLGGLSQALADHALTELAASHLVNENAHGRFAFHDLLRLYAAEQLGALEDPAERRAASRRMLDYYLHTAHSAARAISPTREMLDLEPAVYGARPTDLADEDRAAGWLKSEHQVLTRVITYAADAGFDTHAWQLPWALTDYLDRDGHWLDWAASQRIALAAATRLGDVAAQARAHRYLGRACFELQDYDEAMVQFSQALAQQRLLGNPVGEAGLNVDICRVHEQRGERDKALACTRLALRLYREAGHQVGEAFALNSVGWFYAQDGNYSEALRYCSDALKLCVKLDYKVGEGLTTDRLGFVHLRLGQSAQALACYDRSVGIHRRLGDRYGQAWSLGHLGDAYHVIGDVPAALRAWRDALTILDDLNHPDVDQVRAKISEAASSPGSSAGSEPGTQEHGGLVDGGAGGAGLAERIDHHEVVHGAVVANSRDRDAS
jgi:tetratricopeptide (TPR) repeat protein